MTTPASDASNKADGLEAYLVSGEAAATIYAEGDTSTDVYFIQRGRVELTTSYQGGTYEIAVLGMGEFFGEGALLDEQPRAHTARALGAHTLLKVDRQAFVQIVGERPDIAVRMLRALAIRERHRHAADAIASAAPPPPPEPPPPPPPPPKPRVVKAALIHRATKQRFEVAGPKPAHIGRPDRGTGFTPEVDLSPLDTERTLSRRHAVLVWRDGACFVTEEKATRNGTFVNGQRLTTGGEIELKDGDRIRCGLVELVFHAE